MLRKISILSFLTLGFMLTAFAQESEMPRQIRNWVHYEQVVNDRANDPRVFAQLNFSELPEQYDPKNQRVFDMPFMEIPTSELFLREKDVPESGKKILFFKKDGVDYFRFFIHPLMEENYAKEIKQYGLQRGKYLATTSSSPRSLIVWDKADPSLYIGQKVSLATKIGVKRLNGKDKLERAFAMNDDLSKIPANIKKSLGFDFFEEPIVAHTNAHQYGNITRILPDDLVDGNGRAIWISGFSLAAEPNDGGLPMLVKMLINEGGNIEEALEKRLYGPLIKQYAFLAFERGLIGEPHQQNVKFHRSLNGETRIADLDAFKPDLELRAQKGLSVESFLGPERPYKVLKLNKAPEYFAQSYRSHVRNNWVYLVEQMLEKHKDKFPPSMKSEISEILKGGKLWDLSDRIYLREARRYLSDESLKKAFFTPWSELVKIHQASLEKLFPGKDLLNETLSADDWDNILRAIPVYEFAGWSKTLNGFDQNILPFSPQQMVEAYQASNFMKHNFTQLQLMKEFERLQFNYRASTRKKLPGSLRFEVTPGAIIAFNSKGQHFGTALMEPEDAFSNGNNMYANTPYPRRKPNPALFKKLWHSFRSAEKNATPASTCHKAFSALFQ